MTHAELDRLEQLAKAATPGPWYWEQQPKHGGDRYLYARDDDWQTLASLNAGFPTCDYIAALSPDTLLALLTLAREGLQAREAWKSTSAYRRENEPALRLTHCPTCGEFRGHGHACWPTKEDRK